MYTLNSSKISEQVFAMDQFWSSELGQQLAYEMGLSHDIICSRKWKFVLTEQYNPITSIFSLDKDMGRAVLESVQKIQSFWSVCSDTILQNDHIRPELYFAGLKFQPIISGSSTVLSKIGSTQLIPKHRLTEMRGRPVCDMTMENEFLYAVAIENTLPERFYKVFRDTVSQSKVSKHNYVDFCSLLSKIFFMEYFPDICFSVKNSQLEDKKYLKQLIADPEKFSKFLISHSVCDSESGLSYYEKIQDKYSVQQKTQITELHNILQTTNSQIVFQKSITYLLTFMGILKIIPIDDGWYSPEYQRIEGLVQNTGHRCVPMIPYNPIHY